MRQQGADAVVDGRGNDVAGEIRQLTDGRGADVVADFVGSTETLAQGMAALARGGRLVIVGLSRASEAMVSAKGAALLQDEKSILGSRAFSRAEIADCLALAAAGMLDPVVNHVFPLEQANEAHALVASGRNIGRVVLTIAEP